MVRIRNPWPGRWRFMNNNVYVAKVVKKQRERYDKNNWWKKKSCRQINRNFQKVPTRIQCSTFRGKSCLEEIEHWCRRVFESNGPGVRFEVFIIIGRFSPNRKKPYQSKWRGGQACPHSVSMFIDIRQNDTKNKTSKMKGGGHKPPYHFHLRQKR